MKPLPWMVITAPFTHCVASLAQLPVTLVTVGAGGCNVALFVMVAAIGTTPLGVLTLKSQRPEVPVGTDARHSKYVLVFAVMEHDGTGLDGAMLLLVVVKAKVYADMGREKEPKTWIDAPVGTGFVYTQRVTWSAGAGVGAGVMGAVPGVGVPVGVMVPGVTMMFVTMGDHGPLKPDGAEASGR